MESGGCLKTTAIYLDHCYLLFRRCVAIVCLSLLGSLFYLYCVRKLPRCGF
ncbi:unnamed protein product [Brassica rapa subsp. trilocularis]